MDARSLADRPAAATFSAPEILAKSFRRFDRFEVKLSEEGSEQTFSRDVLRVGRVVGVLPVDLALNEIVLLRQFRATAHLAHNKGEMIEIVAGSIEQGEEPADAGRRECEEEIGVKPRKLVRLLEYLPAPGVVDELVYVLLGEVDASAVPDRAGAPGESERTWPVRVSFDDAVEALNRNSMYSGLTVIALSWLALNKHRLRELLAA